jgi:hypothetical protein
MAIWSAGYPVNWTAVQLDIWSTEHLVSWMILQYLLNQMFWTDTDLTSSLGTDCFFTANICHHWLQRWGLYPSTRTQWPLVPLSRPKFNSNLDGDKKSTAVWLGVICDSQVTNRKQKDSMWGPQFYWSPGSHPRHTPIGCLGVIYDSQPADIQKNTITNIWKLWHFDLKIA